MTRKVGINSICSVRKYEITLAARGLVRQHHAVSGSVVYTKLTYIINIHTQQPINRIVVYTHNICYYLLIIIMIIETHLRRTHHLH